MDSAAAIELYNYTFARGRIDRSEVDSLPPVRTIRKARRCANTDELQGMMSLNDFITPMISQNRRFYNRERNFDRTGQRARGHHPPDTLQGIEALLRCPCEQKVLPRTPAVLVYGIMGRDLNRIYRGQHIYGPILCYGWKGNNIQPMSKDVQAEMLDRLKDTEVRV